MNLASPTWENSPPRVENCDCSDPYKSSAQSSMSSHLGSVADFLFLEVSVGLKMFHHKRYERKEWIKCILSQHPSEIMPSCVRQHSAVKSVHFFQATRVLPATQHHLSMSYWPKATVILSMCRSQKQRWSVPLGYITFLRLRGINYSS